MAKSLYLSLLPLPLSPLPLSPLPLPPLPLPPQPLLPFPLPQFLLSSLTLLCYMSTLLVYGSSARCKVYIQHTCTHNELVNSIYKVEFQEMGNGHHQAQLQQWVMVVIFRSMVVTFRSMVVTLRSMVVTLRSMVWADTL